MSRSARRRPGDRSGASHRLASRQRDALLHALVQNGWIVAGVLALGWSASTTLGGIYLETLFCSVALQIAVRRAGRAHVESGESIQQDGVVRSETLAERTKTTTMIGLAQGVFLLAFGAGAFLDETLDPIWRFTVSDLGQVAVGALATAVIEYRRLRHAMSGSSAQWLRTRVQLQFSTTLALVLFMLILPWSFFLVGERGLFVVLIGGKAALDTWLARLR